MIDRGNFIDTTLQKLAALSVGQALDIRSFKRNRKVVITKTDTGYHVLEDGFAQEIFADLTEAALTKLLRTIEKREFPRSNKLRFYVLDTDEASINRANYRLDEENIIAEEYDPTFAVLLRCDYSYYDKLRHLITHLGGEMTHTHFTHDVTIEARIEEAHYDELSQLLWLSIKRQP